MLTRHQNALSRSDFSKVKCMLHKQRSAIICTVLGISDLSIMQIIWRKNYHNINNHEILSSIRWKLNPFAKAGPDNDTQSCSVGVSVYGHKWQASVCQRWQSFESRVWVPDKFTNLSTHLRHIHNKSQHSWQMTKEYQDTFSPTGYILLQSATLLSPWNNTPFVYEAA